MASVDCLILLQRDSDFLYQAKAVEVSICKSKENEEKNCCISCVFDVVG